MASHYTLANFIADCGITTADLDMIWNLSDTDQDGYIANEELEQFASNLISLANEKRVMDLSKSDSDLHIIKTEIINACDENGDNKLGYKEMANMCNWEEATPNTEYTTTKQNVNTNIHSSEFIQIWKKYDKDKNNYIEATELDDFLADIMPKDDATTIADFKSSILAQFDSNYDGKISIQELSLLLPVEQNVFKQFENSGVTLTEFESIFKHYDYNNDDTINGDEIIGFLYDLLSKHHNTVTMSQIEDYAVAMKDLYDVNKDGRFSKKELLEMIPVAP